MSVTLMQRQFSVDEYNRMGVAGILADDERVELIDGVIVPMTPIGPPHAGIVNRLAHILISRLGTGAVVAVQNPVRLDRFNELQPDFAVLKPRADFYSRELPHPADVLWLVEACDSSIKKDREIKVPLFAKAEIPELWLVDVRGQVLEVHREPRDGGFRVVRRLQQGEEVRPVMMPDVAFGVDEIFG
jgi:Uma2 family endonuclease